MTVLSCAGLGFKVREAQLLSDIHLEVQPGETLGIVGSECQDNPPRTCGTPCDCSTE